jgi:hypothetical protein
MLISKRTVLFLYTKLAGKIIKEMEAVREERVNDTNLTSNIHNTSFSIHIYLLTVTVLYS